jgi:hypothetical protein
MLFKYVAAVQFISSFYSMITVIAICPNINEVHIYGTIDGSGEWRKLHTLSDHDLLVTSIDWVSVKIWLR